MLSRLLAGATLALALGHAGTPAAEEVIGAGSTFAYPIIAKWSAAYSDKTGERINYQSIGSGAGMQEIRASTVDFGASDMPLPPDDLQKSDLGQWPIVIGGVVPVVNIDGVAPGGIRFTGPLLADIYLGKIKKWNEPAVAQLNPGVALPDAEITVIHRSDGSGTTFNWADYLSKMSPAWKTTVGEGASVQWPVGVGGRGNEGVAAWVKQIKNSIGYVELAYALQGNLSYAAVQNAAGQFVLPSAASFQAAAASADWKGAKDFYLVITNAPGESSWPITATTFVMMHKQPQDKAKAKAALGFFRWALDSGQPQASELKYVPLPKELVEQVEAYWSSQFAH